MPSTGNMGTSGQDDTQEKVVDLEHQLRRLEGDFAFQAARIKSEIPTKGEIDALVHPKQFDDMWEHLRKLEKRFHWVQGNYHPRISSTQAVTARCKRQVQASSVSHYSNVDIGGSLSAPRH